MKKVLFPMLAAVVVYLLGAFANAGFDISAWEGYTRAMVALFMGGAAVCVLGAMCASNEVQR